MPDGNTSACHWNVLTSRCLEWESYGLPTYICRQVVDHGDILSPPRIARLAAVRHRLTPAFHCSLAHTTRFSVSKALWKPAPVHPRLPSCLPPILRCCLIHFDIANSENYEDTAAAGREASSPIYLLYN
jgi:hypothetical protein